MTTVAEAEAALATARQRHAETDSQLAAARSHLAAVCAQAPSGTVVPGELSAARDAVELAEAVRDGAEAALQPLEESLAEALADAECDRIVTSLRSLGGTAARALERLEEAVADFAAASAAYDDFVRAESNDLRTRCGRSPRFSDGRAWKLHTVDGLRMNPSSPMAQLALALVPHAKSLGASQTLIQDLRALAQGAPLLPRDDQ